MAKLRDFKTLLDLLAAFPTEQHAIDHFRAIRWAGGAFCPYCGSDRVMHFSDKRTHKCHECRQRFSIKVGTIFEDSKVGMRKWLAAIWLITNQPKGIASTQLAKDVGVTQKTAWFMLHRLRYATRTRSFNKPLTGQIEADETRFGGKEDNKPLSKRVGHAKNTVNKIVVMGMLERGGEIRASVIPNLKLGTVQGQIRANVQPGATLITDDFGGYRSLKGEYDHNSVNHSKKEYVRGVFHTNGIEGAWSLFKRQYHGTHHWISAKHMDRYLGEMCYRYTWREMSLSARVNDFLSRTEGRLTYKALIA
jgi:transposase-like protein